MRLIVLFVPYAYTCKCGWYSIIIFHDQVTYEWLKQNAPISSLLSHIVRFVAYEIAWVDAIEN